MILAPGGGALDVHLATQRTWSVGLTLTTTRSTRETWSWIGGLPNAARSSCDEGALGMFAWVPMPE